MKQKLGNWLRQAFAGRYGVDQLSLAILVLDLILCLVGTFTRNGWLNLLAYIPMVLVLYRMLSKNTYRRYQENRRFLQLVDRIKDRKNRYFKCPKCKQLVRVPRGKGKISITCPRCKEKFVKKTSPTAGPTCGLPFRQKNQNFFRFSLDFLPICGII